MYCPIVMSWISIEYLSQVYRIFGIVSILLLVPSLILKLIFIYRYKSTFLHRQFLYTTIVLVLIGIINILYPSSFCFRLILYNINLYMLYVEILQITTIHLHLLYKFSKHIETRTKQRLQALCCKLCKNIETRPIQRLRACCCNIRPRLWHDVIIVCIQIGLPLPILIANFFLNSHALYKWK